MSFTAINWSNADGNQGDVSFLWLFLPASLVVQKIRNFSEFSNQVNGTNMVPGTINLRILLDAR